MKSLKKALLTVSAFLLATVQCLSFAACGNETAKTDGDSKTAAEYEEASPYGIYTDLQFSLNGENGLVRAAIKNKFTLFPSTVTVNLELYRSENYSESFEEMTLSASNYIYDLDQGETLAVHASTDGKKSYWKAKARYKVDNKAWQEKVSETVYLDENGIVTSEPAQKPAPEPDDREYYVSDFLQGEAQNMQVTIPDNIPNSLFLYNLENEDLLIIKNTIGEVKLELFEIDSLERELFYQAAIGFWSDYSLFINYGNGKTVSVIIDDGFQNELNANLFVKYNDNGERKNFKCLLTDETKEEMLLLAKNMYESKKENK